MKYTDYVVAEGLGPKRISVLIGTLEICVDAKRVNIKDIMHRGLFLSIYYYCQFI